MSGLRGAARCGSSRMRAETSRAAFRFAHPARAYRRSAASACASCRVAASSPGRTGLHTLRRAWRRHGSGGDQGAGFGGDDGVTLAVATDDLCSSAESSFGAGDPGAIWSSEEAAPRGFPETGTPAVGGFDATVPGQGAPGGESSRSVGAEGVRCLRLRLTARRSLPEPPRHAQYPTGCAVIW